MKKTVFKIIVIIIVVFSVTTVSYIAHGTELGPETQLPLYTQVFNKIMYGNDQGKNVEEMLLDDIVPYNAQAVCEDDTCYTWNVFLDRDKESVPVGLGDITRLGVGDTIGCAVNEALYDIDAVDGHATCTPVKHCYYRQTVYYCDSGYTNKGNGICCTF